MRDFGVMPGRYPAIVREYLPAQRACRVMIPGLTDGADVLPLAEIEYSIGDKSKAGAYATEIEILPGDTVWIAFIGGDPRYPIITGWRNPQAGNGVDWRRWHHANIELLADAIINIKGAAHVLVESGTLVTVRSPEVEVDSPITRFTGEVTVAGNVAFDGSSVTHGGVNIGSTHRHTSVSAGPSTSGPPQG